VITVADTGIGMTSEEVSHAFDRFWRADSSRNRNTGGSGVGLAVCGELVRAHGGHIEISSTPGEGTTFTVRLPLE
jgi:two-component system sensor histidine kinase BaeS